MNSITKQIEAPTIKINSDSIGALGCMLAAHCIAIDSGELRVVDPDGFDPFQVVSAGILLAARNNLIGKNGTTTVSIDDVHTAFDTIEAAHLQAGSTTRIPLSSNQRAMLAPAFEHIRSLLEHPAEPGTIAA